MSRQTTRNAFVGMASMVLAAAAHLGAIAAETPLPVAPGDLEEFAAIAERCPTFIWGGLEGTTAYELVVYEVGREQGGFQDGGLPRIRVEIPGTALAWKPSLGDALEPGGEYAWLIRALGEPGTIGDWSPPRLFRVDGSPSVGEVRAAVDLLRRFLGEETQQVDRRSEQAPVWLAAGAEAGAPGISGRATASDLQASAPQGPPDLPPAVPAAVPTVGHTCLSLDGDVSLDDRSGIFKRNVFTAQDEPFIWDYEVLYHTAVGRRALGSTITGIYNTAVGMDALADNTRGSYNTAVGAWALLRNSQPSSSDQGSRNTALGAWSLLLNTSGSRNTAVGSEALYQNTFASDNTAIGHEALNANTLGKKNTAIGSGALRANKGETPWGSRNTAVGFEALDENTEGEHNSAVGASAMSKNDTGHWNTAVGFAALSGNLVGNSNVAVGHSALSFNVDHRNTAIGRNALRYKTAGSRNIAVGFEAGTSLGSGAYNIYIGSSGGGSENHTIRVGEPYDADSSSGHNRAFVAGIWEALVSPAFGARPVYVYANGQLGTPASSRRFKQEIRDMAEASSGLLRLRPVTFRFRADPRRDEQPLSYGLIAEEVAAVYPELAYYDGNGEPYGVHYEALVPMLLNELQKQRHRIETLESHLARLRDPEPGSPPRAAPPAE